MEFDINWLAVLAGTVAHQALGALWYAVLFKSTWLRAMGMTAEQVERQVPGSEMAVGVVASLISVVALAAVIGMIDAPTLSEGILIGAVAGIGFVAAATFMNGMYEDRNPILSTLFSAYYTVGLMAAGAILALWQ